MQEEMPRVLKEANEGLVREHMGPNATTQKYFLGRSVMANTTDRCSRMGSEM